MLRLVKNDKILNTKKIHTVSPVFQLSLKHHLAGSFETCSSGHCTTNEHVKTLLLTVFAQFIYSSVNEVWFCFSKYR